MYLKIYFEVCFYFVVIIVRGGERDTHRERERVRLLTVSGRRNRCHDRSESEEEEEEEVAANCVGFRETQHTQEKEESLRG